TPQLVSPVPVGKRPALPGSDTFEPDDLQFFIWGDLEGNIAEDYRSPVRSNLKRMEAFRHAEQKYILGMPGHSSGRPFPEPAIVTERVR
ncbi:MAG: secretion system protein, partial [Pirellulaceae bacterium]